MLNRRKLILAAPALILPRKSLATSMTTTGAGVQSSGGAGGTAPVIDSNSAAANYFAFATASSAINNSSAGLVTAGTNRVVVLYLVSANTGSAAPTFSTPTSTNSLTYTLRNRFSWHFTSSIRGAYFANLEIWSAPAAAQITVSGPGQEIITATASASANSLGVFMFAFSGCGSGPFDPNASLPASNSNFESSGTQPNVTGKSITNSGTLGLAFNVFIANTSPAAYLPAQTGWTALGGQLQNSASPIFTMQLQTQAFTTPQSGTFSFGPASGTPPPFGDWGIALNALSS